MFFVYDEHPRYITWGYFKYDNFGEDNWELAFFKKRGFVSEDFNTERVRIDSLSSYSITPMNYCCQKGYLRLCQYLYYRHGVDCRKRDSNDDYPMCVAAQNGYDNILRWLYLDGGVHEDIGIQNGRGESALSLALEFDHRHSWKWLLLNGGLPPGDDARLRHDFKQRPYCYFPVDQRLDVFEWAQDTVATRDNVLKLLLTGLIDRRHPKNTYATRSSQNVSSLTVFKTFQGILELILHFAVGTPQQLRTPRQLIERLPIFMREVPFVREWFEEDPEMRDVDDEVVIRDGEVVGRGGVRVRHDARRNHARRTHQLFWHH